MKKGIAIVPENLVALLLVLLTGIILLYVTGLMSQIINSLNNDLLCQGSFIASAMAKTVSLGAAKVDPNCQTNRILLVSDIPKEPETETGEKVMSLSRDYGSTILLQHSTYERARLMTFELDEFDGSELPYFDDKGISRSEAEDPSNEEMLYVKQRYNMDKIIADELKTCWKISGRGKLPLFDNYWKFIGCDGEECTSETFWTTWDFEFRDSANFCVLCSRIKFDEDIQEEYDDTYDSIYTWMGNHPYKIDETESYYEYLLSEEQEDEFFARPSYSYSTQEPLAVLFIRKNWHMATQPAKWISNLPKGKDNDQVRYLSTLKVVPYSQIPDTCDYMVGSYV